MSQIKTLPSQIRDESVSLAYSASRGTTLVAAMFSKGGHSARCGAPKGCDYIRALVTGSGPGGNY
jgi:hypothetical protein